MFLSKPIQRKQDYYKSQLRELLLGGYQSKTGISINWKTALECATVLACVRVIAEGIAQIPWKLYRQQGDKRNPAVDHPLYDLIYLNPNEWQTSYEFREQIATHLALARNAYVFVNRSVTGKILELLPIEPGMMLKTPILQPGLPAYRYTATWHDGSQTEIPSQNLWHLRGLSWNGIDGLDGVKLAREIIGLDMAMEGHSSSLFRNGTKHAGALQTDAMMKKEQADEFREQWQQHYAGTENAGKTPILHSGLKWVNTNLSSVDAQLLESRRFQVEQICSAMRVLPIMIGYSDKTATYASAEQMFLAHVVHSLGPWIARLEQSADKFLLTKQQRQEGLYTCFTAQALLRGAHKDRAEYFAKALGAGGSPAWMTQDEVRACEEMNPMGGTAATLPLPTNTGTKTSPANAN